MTLPLTAAALTPASTGRVDLLGIGDSITESSNASHISLRYFDRLVASLQSTYNAPGVAGGRGWANTFHNSGTPSGWAFSAGGGVQNNAGFLGYRGRSFETDQTATLTFTGTGFSLHFVKGDAFITAGTFTVSIDGGAPTLVTPAGNPQNTRGVWTSPALAAGAHTAVITPSSGKQLYLYGAHILNGDAASGVHGWEAGHFGTTAAAYNVSSLADFCALHDPKLVTVFLGANDLPAGTTAASFKSSVAGILSAVDGYCAGSPTFLLLSPYVRSDLTPSVPQSAYATALADLAAASPGTTEFYDLGAAFVPAANPGSMADAVHPNDTGHASLASLIAGQITGTTTPPPAPEGAGWAAVGAERWNGSSWQPLVAEQWTGSAWVGTTTERAT